MHEVIDNNTDRCMVFECLDINLWSLRIRAQELSQSFLKITVKSILEAVKVFSDMNGHFTAVHTDTHNTYMQTTTSGMCSGVEIHAPEIWKGVLPTLPCQVWLVRVTLTHFFINKVIFGNWDQDSCIQEFPLDTNKSVWAIGKIMKLVEPLE
ncbi:uncharacterized protein CIMG_13528 [Coccidioides immitis RS]|uniref:Uncharacterized protein n=1 Tax=Coccidioides immitis (strain RS) TaxID=246410 RepID=A0A0D8JVV3_COCIM|nr:uncharacterized protein CIMG_13528 [Coccidioides immitis RS]KJF61234.1 hypothetical protein CIMG_13528 [Coccidioides immitis RS]